MSELVRSFVKLSQPWNEEQFSGKFGSPTCQKAEHGFRPIFQRGIRRRTLGEIRNDRGLTVAKLYSANVSHADEWIPGAPHLIFGNPVLVKNPYMPRTDADCGEKNAITEFGGYLFVARVGSDAFRLRRPVRGKNYDGSQIDYQSMLGESFAAFLKSLPAGYQIPVWTAPDYFIA